MVNTSFYQWNGACRPVYRICDRAGEVYRDTLPFSGSEQGEGERGRIDSAPFSLGSSARRGGAQILLLCALATSIGPAAAQAPLQLQPLVNDAVAQLQLGYRHNRTEQQRRYDELNDVVEAWLVAPRTDANNRMLEDWLRGAIRNSMPGSRNALPPLPQFEQAATITAPHDALPHEVAPSDRGIEEVSNAAPTTSADGQPGEDATVPSTGSPDAVAPNLADTDPADIDPFVDDPVPAE